MATSDAKRNDRAVDIQPNLRGKKLLKDRMKAPIFLEAVLKIQTMEEPECNFE